MKLSSGYHQNPVKSISFWMIYQSINKKKCRIIREILASTLNSIVGLSRQPQVYHGYVQTQWKKTYGPMAILKTINNKPIQCGIHNEIQCQMFEAKFKQSEAMVQKLPSRPA